MVEAQARPYTYKDLEAFPEDHRYRYEIIDGDLVVSPSPGERHQAAVVNLVFAIRAFLEVHPIGSVYVAPFDVLFSEVNVVEPDLLFVGADRKSLIEQNGVHGAPDLVIEVLSPSTRRTDVTRKKDLYERGGVREYWIVHPEERWVEMLRLAGGVFVHFATLAADRHEVLTSPVLPGFSLELQRLFA